MTLLITFIPDGPVHDFRYVINFTKIQNEFGWRPVENFQSTVLKTVSCYLENPSGCGSAAYLR